MDTLLPSLYEMYICAQLKLLQDTLYFVLSSFTMSPIFPAALYSFNINYLSLSVV